MTFRHAAALSLLLAAAWAQAAALGRLFFTPEQRAILDKQRQANFRSLTDGRSALSALTVNGVVERSGGHHTAWINGITSDESQGIPGIQPFPIPGTSGSIRLEGEANKPAVKVGDTYRPDTGESHDQLQGGKIVIRQLGLGPGKK